MAKRVDKIREFLNDKNIDALLIQSKTMKKWMSTMLGSGCNVLITRQHGYLVLDGRYITEAKEKEFDLEIILHNPHTSGKSYYSTVEKLLKQNDCHSLGVEASEVMVKDYHNLQEMGIDIHLLDDDITNLRIIKDASEIETMKKTVALTDDIYAKVLQHIKIGMTEYEISALLQYYAISKGATQMSFDTIVSSGPRTAFPHARPTERQIKRNEPIMIDFGVQIHNYQSDITRMLFIGAPSQKLLDIYETVYEAQTTALSKIRVGMKGKEVDMVARNIIKNRGYGDFFGHGLGHGIGIGDGSELPYLNPSSKIVLQENMLMSCEPGVYVPGVGGVRIEDDVLIKNGRGIALNHTPKELCIL